MLLSWQKDINEGTGRPEEDRAVESMTYLSTLRNHSGCKRHSLGEARAESRLLSASSACSPLSLNILNLGLGGLPVREVS